MSIASGGGKERVPVAESGSREGETKVVSDHEKERELKLSSARRELSLSLTPPVGDECDSGDLDLAQRLKSSVLGE